MSFDIRHITRDEILHGFAEDYYCCMSGILHRRFQCDMWSVIFDRVGSIGLLARAEDKIVAQLIHIPKDVAQRIGMPRGVHGDDLALTMVISCVAVQPQLNNRGIATGMIGEAINFCREQGYKRIEAYVDPRPPQEAADWIPSFSAFSKFGFAIEGAAIAWESHPQSRICYLDL
jgi:GNAT superfamily N-acetyltransferase